MIQTFARHNVCLFISNIGIGIDLLLYDNGFKSFLEKVELTLSYIRLFRILAHIFAKCSFPGFVSLKTLPIIPYI